MLPCCSLYHSSNIASDSFPIYCLQHSMPDWLCVDYPYSMQVAEKGFGRAMEVLGACLSGFAQESWSQHHSSEL